MKMSEINVENEDLYELLGVSIEAEITDIKKAYRKKALSVHPDKNPDNPNASKEFHKLSKVLEILTDVSARRAYDRVLKGRKEAALRTKQLDSKRQKFKADLEERERRAAKGSKPERSADEQLRDEIERLRREGSKEVQEEMDYVMRELKRELSRIVESDERQSYKLKIKWKASKNDTLNGGYNQENLNQFLLKYGDINALVISVKNGSGLVDYKTRRAAEMAIDIEKGLADNPIELSWIDKSMDTHRKASSTIKETDYETLVMTKLRQAEERKRLIAQMMAEDENS